MKIIEKELKYIDAEVFKDFIEPSKIGFLKEFLQGPSKRIRSAIAILFLLAHNKELTSDIIKIIAIVEIIHNASLLHDDVIDNAELRRGETTISKKYSPNIAILSGDYLLAFAISKLNSINNKEITNIFLECTKLMCSAEIEQYFSRGQILTAEDYIRICKNKTALLFISLFDAIAILLNLDRYFSRKFAELFGIIFQIKNDLDDFSALQDQSNEIFTARDILGVENTKILLDNYYKEISLLMQDIPNNVYKKKLEELVWDYVR